MPKNEMDRLNLWKAALVAPLVAPVMYLIGTSVFGVGPDGIKDAAFLLLIISVFAIPVAYAGTIAAGLPVVIILKRNNALNTKNVLISGFVIGGLLFLATMFVMSRNNFDVLAPPQLIWYLGAGGVIGGAVALVFSLLAGITKPSSGHSR